MTAPVELLPLEYARRLHDLAINCEIDNRAGDASDLRRIAGYLAAIRIGAPAQGSPDRGVMEATAAQHFDLPKGRPAQFVRNGILETCRCLDCTALAQPTQGGDKGEPVAWCQPMDNGKRTPRKFIIYFEDVDRGIAIYEDEVEARKAFEQATMTWNCYLFGALPLAAPIPASNTQGVQELQELEDDAFRGGLSAEAFAAVQSSKDAMDDQRDPDATRALRMEQFEEEHRKSLDTLIAWPPLKKALWNVLMTENLNDGHYIRAFDLIEKLYSAALASSSPKHRCQNWAGDCSAYISTGVVCDACRIANAL